MIGTLIAACCVSGNLYHQLRAHEKSGLEVSCHEIIHWWCWMKNSGGVSRSSGVDVLGHWMCATNFSANHPIFVEQFHFELKWRTDRLTERLPHSHVTTVAKSCHWTVPILLVFTLLRKQWGTDLISSPAPWALCSFWLWLLRVSSCRELLSAVFFRRPPRLQAAPPIVLHNCVAYRFPLQAWVWGRMESKMMCQWERREEIKRKTKQHLLLISLNTACIRYPVR